MSRLKVWWIRESRWGRIPDQPIVHLLADSEPERLIDALGERLRGVAPNATLDFSASPNAENTGDATENEDEERTRSRELRILLDQAARQFLEDHSAKRVGRLRFRRYALLSWLLNKNMPPSEPADGPNRHIRQLLKQYFGFGNRTQPADQPESAAWSSAEQQLPWYLFLLAWLAYPVYYWWQVRFGRIPRWFMRQRYLSPGESEDFPSFAQRLIETPSKHENAHQVRKLLVHAFLTDLADSYARGPRWRWIPKDSYPVLLLRGLEPGTLGETLVLLVNDVRNETILRDPLFVVGSGTRQLPHDPPPGSGTLAQWPDHLQVARRRRSPTAWYRPALVTDTADGDEPLTAGRQLPLRHSLAWRRVPATALVLSLLACGGLYLHHYFGPCGQLIPVHGVGPFGSDTEVWAEGEECVGLSDGGFAFTPEIPAAGAEEAQELRDQLDNVQSGIINQNRDIADAHEREKRLGSEAQRPYVTVVYFGTLTAPDPNSSTLNGVLEELRGVKHAQYRAWQDGNVLLRVVFANGGDRMNHAPAVAKRIGALAELARAPKSPSSASSGSVEAGEPPRTRPRNWDARACPRSAPPLRPTSWCRRPRCTTK